MSNDLLERAATVVIKEEPEARGDTFSKPILQFSRFQNEVLEHQQYASALDRDVDHSFHLHVAVAKSNEVTRARHTLEFERPGDLPRSATWPKQEASIRT